MSPWWKNTKDILKGKAKSSKLIVLGVFMLSVSAILIIGYPIHGYAAGAPFLFLGIYAFVYGVLLYVSEVKAELEKRK